MQCKLQGCAHQLDGIVQAVGHAGINAEDDQGLGHGVWWRWLVQVCLQGGLEGPVVQHSDHPGTDLRTVCVADACAVVCTYSGTKPRTHCAQLQGFKMGCMGQVQRALRRWNAVQKASDSGSTDRWRRMPEVARRQEMFDQEMPY